MKKHRSFYTVIIVVCILIISVGVYYLLGGFDPIRIYYFAGTNRTVIGKEYYLPDQRKDFWEKLDSAKADLLDGTIKGNLVAVVYQDEWTDRDSIHCFIGASQDSTQGVLRIPAGYEYKQFETERIYKVFMTQNRWIQPTPGTIEEIMEVKSIEEGEVLQPYSFELYYRDGSSSVEKWVK